MALACLAMALAAVHRAAFSVLALPIQAALGLSMPDMGRAHAALLVGYLLGQVGVRGLGGQGGSLIGGRRAVGLLQCCTAPDPGSTIGAHLV